MSLVDPRGVVTQRQEDLTDPDEILKATMSFEGTGIFLLHDFRHYMEDNPVIQRRLRDVACKLSQGKQGKHVIIVGTEMCLPPDLEKDMALVDRETGESLKDVGGLGSLKQWLKRRGQAFSPEAKKYGLSTPKGVLLVGLPGTGKSMFAKAIAKAWRLPLLTMDISALFGSLVGESEGNMRRALRTAEAMAPCVLHVDEIEKGFGDAGSLDGGTSLRVFGKFLNWMQEKGEKQVFVVATANDVSRLPPEMLRKGRFDEIFFTDLPDVEEREEILRIHLKKRKRNPDNFDMDLISTSLNGFSGAEIEEAVKEGLFLAFPSKLEDSHILRAVGATTPLSKTMAERVKELREWAHTRARYAGKAKKSNTTQAKKAESTGRFGNVKKKRKSS
jgi:AAA+ superfamily predicted ATPase